jgi:hypothetical protein
MAVLVALSSIQDKVTTTTSTSASTSIGVASQLAAR